jgi:flagellin-like hook-associated protein FlgL
VYDNTTPSVVINSNVPSAYKVSGSLSLKADGSGHYTATFLTNDVPPKEIELKPDATAAASGKISFNLTDGRNAEVFSYKAEYTLTAATGGAALDLTAKKASLSVSVKGSIPSMQPGDLTLNGVTIGESFAKYDTLSPANNAAGSAIAKAAAINLQTDKTGVHAVVNENVMSGTAMTGTSIVTGYVTINGVASPTIATSLNDPRESRATTVRAINLISDKTGVIAIDTGEDAQGIKLVAKDGRNIELVIHTNDGTDAFAARTGVRAGVKAGTYSLESKVEKDIVVGTTLTGDLSTTGLRAGTYTNHWIDEKDPRRLLPITDPNYVSASDAMFKHPAVNSAERALVLGSDDNSKTKQLRAGDLVINGIAIPGSDPSGDILTEEASLVTAKNLRASTAIATAAAINTQYEKTGVRAVANPTITEGKFTEIDSTNQNSKQSIYVNGVEVQVQFGDATTESTTDRLKTVKAAMDEQFGRTGVEATVNDQGGLTLTAKDGRNVSVWFDSDIVSAKEFGLAVSSTDAGKAVSGVKGDSGADATYTEGDVLFSTVSLVSDKPIDIQPGINGYGSTSNFEAMGFQTGTFGGVVDEAVSKMTPPRTGRLYFHVGASANQSITIDLADFGKGGPITSDITWDVDMDPLPAGSPLPDLGKDAEGNPIQTPQRSFISSKDSATSVLARLDVVMDKVNATRATMGAVMNRLDHVINNLTNVSMNMSASRSQIEDADYASASTELAKTQIMQQAATAVLAQANTSQQSVLKLLGG